MVPFKKTYFRVYTTTATTTATAATATGTVAAATVLWCYSPNWAVCLFLRLLDLTHHLRHKHTHTWSDSSEWVICSLHNTTNIKDEHSCFQHDSNHNHSNHAAAVLCLKPYGHWTQLFRPLLSKTEHHILLFTYYNSEVVSYVKRTHNGWSKYSNDWDLFDFRSTEFWILHIQFRDGRTHIMISHNKTHRKHGSNNL